MKKKRGTKKHVGLACLPGTDDIKFKTWEHLNVFSFLNDSSEVELISTYFIIFLSE